MSDPVVIRAEPWWTPFGEGDPDHLHIVRIDCPSAIWVSRPDGRFYDFAKFLDQPSMTVWVFCEATEVLYRIEAEPDSIYIHDEREASLMGEWNAGRFRTVRVHGSHLQRSLSSLMAGEQASYMVLTGNDCVEFLSLNEPQIVKVGRVPPT